jgi:arsenate reductase
MTEDVFLHNPRCSTSRTALALVRDAGVDLPVREYLREPLSIEELRHLVQLLNVRPIDLVRRRESESKTLGLSDETSDEDVLRAIAKHPILLQRPIVVRGGRAVLARPADAVKAIL